MSSPNFAHWSSVAALSLRSASRVCRVSVSSLQAHDTVADFIPRNVEQDLNRLLDDSNSGVALRGSCTPSPSVLKFISSRIRSQKRHVCPLSPPHLSQPTLRHKPTRAVPTSPSRPVAIYEARRIGPESAEPHAKSSGAWRKQKHELVWPAEPMQDESGTEVARKVAETAFDQPTCDRSVSPSSFLLV